MGTVWLLVGICIGGALILVIEAIVFSRAQKNAPLLDEPYDQDTAEYLTDLEGRLPSARGGGVASLPESSLGRGTSPIGRESARSPAATSPCDVPSATGPVRSARPEPRPVASPE